MRDRCAQNGTGLCGLYRYVERLLLGKERSDRDEGRTHRRSPQPRWTYDYGESKLEGNDPGNEGIQI